MSQPMTPQAFVAKWQDVALKERAAVQEHFLDLCALIGHPTPAQDDPHGTRFTFEAGAEKLDGRQGWADVWKRGVFAWEYKGKHANLDKAYQQLQQYRESLENPPLLVVSDIDRIVVHTNFTNTVKQTYTITLEDLRTPQGLDRLKAIFREPNLFRAAQTTEQVTREAASQFAQLAQHLHGRGEQPEAIAHFLIRLLFCLFAEDIDLLPKGLFTRLVDVGRHHPDAFNRQLRGLFAAMAQGDIFGEYLIRRFNGGLFDDGRTLELDGEGLRILHGVAGLDWASIEPSILGTLFERSLDPTKRAMLGAHYTSKDDILLIVEPVLMAPLRREWAAVQAQARDLAARRDAAQTQRTRNERTADLRNLLGGFSGKIAATRVLDPACGSGNFLYVALQQLLHLEKEVSLFAGEVGLPGLFPQASPAQLYGIEINEYAHELAQATVWIGYIQWLHENGYGVPSEPILKPLDTIKQMDAILAYDAAGNPVEPEWPQAEVIIGNPPFLGASRLRSELGSEYTEVLYQLYGTRLPACDLVCYWFEKARAHIDVRVATRAGLLATQGIRGGANRTVLERIKQTGDIFWAVSDRNWVLDGAIVHVSMVGFDNGSEQYRALDGKQVGRINADLTAQADVTQSHNLSENRSLSFKGAEPGGPFDISSGLARSMLSAPVNPNGRTNADVVRPVMNAADLMGKSRGMFTIDFGLMELEEAAEYELPFEYVKAEVYPLRVSNKEPIRARYWWRYARPRPDMRQAIKGLSRFIVTPGVSRHRVFAWADHQTVCNNLLCIIARDDDYFFGVLHSRLHEVWSRRIGTQLREAESGQRYTSTTTFETFSFPWPPGQEPGDDPRVQAIAQAAADLNAKREAWLNPPGASEAELKKRTLTNLYNARPTWLDLAHRALDAAVFAAYGWPSDLSDEEILARLLALNLARARAG